jgi:hypothetical protein
LAAAAGEPLLGLPLLLQAALLQKLISVALSRSPAPPFYGCEFFSVSASCNVIWATTHGRDSLFLFLQWRREESASLFYSWQLSYEILKAMQKVKADVVCVFHPLSGICLCVVFAHDETMTMQYFFIALS